MDWILTLVKAYQAKCYLISTLEIFTFLCTCNKPVATLVTKFLEVVTQGNVFVILVTVQYIGDCICFKLRPCMALKILSDPHIAQSTALDFQFVSLKLFNGPTFLKLV